MKVKFCPECHHSFTAHDHKGGECRGSYKQSCSCRRQRRAPISSGEQVVHMVLSLCTAWLWLPIYIAREKSTEAMASNEGRGS